MIKEITIGSVEEGEQTIDEKLEVIRKKINEMLREQNKTK